MHPSLLATPPNNVLDSKDIFTVKFDLYLDEGICYSTSPFNSSSHWKQAIYPFADPVAVEADQDLMLSAQQGLTKIDFQVEI